MQVFSLFARANRPYFAQKRHLVQRRFPESKKSWLISIKISQILL